MLVPWRSVLTGEHRRARAQAHEEEHRSSRSRRRPRSSAGSSRFAAESADVDDGPTPPPGARGPGEARGFRAPAQTPAIDASASSSPDESDRHGVRATPRIRASGPEKRRADGECDKRVGGNDIAGARRDGERKRSHGHGSDDDSDPLRAEAAGPGDGPDRPPAADAPRDGARMRALEGRRSPGLGSANRLSAIVIASPELDRGVVGVEGDAWRERSTHTTGSRASIRGTRSCT